MKLADLVAAGFTAFCAICLALFLLLWHRLRGWD